MVLSAAARAAATTQLRNASFDGDLKTVMSALAAGADVEGEGMVGGGVHGMGRSLRSSCVCICWSS